VKAEEFPTDYLDILNHSFFNQFYVSLFFAEIINKIFVNSIADIIFQY